MTSPIQRVSRRTFLGAGMAVGAASLVPGSLVMPSLSEAAVSTSTTLGRTIRPGAGGAGGYRKLVAGPGEPLIVRNDLGIPVQSTRVKTRRPLLAFAQLSDVHVVDDQSPLRVEWTDRMDDPSQVPATGLFAAAYRPHEMLTAHIADSMVRAVNAVPHGPVTQAEIAFVIQTGDNSDNCQYNEIRWNIDILDGVQVTPDSGSTTAYEGVMRSDNPMYYDPAYWHPEGPAAGKGADDLTTQHGFPAIDGLLDAARKPFKPEGLAVEWYTAFGNHDGLIQGNFPEETTHLGAVATGTVKLVSPPTTISPAKAASAVKDPTSLLGILTDPSNVVDGVAMVVSADANRRHVTRAQIVDEHFKTAGRPVGHGYTPKNQSDGTAYYYFDKGPQGIVRSIVLDTVNPSGYSDGSLDQAQFSWLQDLLADSTDKVVVIFSHHTSETMSNPLKLTDLDLDPSPRVLGDAVVAELLTHPQVIAWVNGHTHKNQIWAHVATGRTGFWEINTASHIDYPQQARIIEIADNCDGTMSIFTTILDHAAPIDGGHAIDSPLALASLARELSVNDPQIGTTLVGLAADRNAELLVASPFGCGRVTTPGVGSKKDGTAPAGTVPSAIVSGS